MACRKQAMQHTGTTGHGHHQVEALLAPFLCRGPMSEKSETLPAIAGRNRFAAFGSGAFIGTLGGLIGLGGAEFRLPLLISLFRFRGLEADILNKATSLIVVATALPLRAATVPFADVWAHWPIIVNLLAGSLLGAWAGGEWATRLKAETLYRTIAVLLVIIAGVLLSVHDTAASAPAFTVGVRSPLALSLDSSSV